ncbi:MAG: 2-hydroxyacid dehydrogenase [Clostridiales Family XIII bacterium]|jgi:lactate dehydrogenase-like 2-hydroxyacid dehydrogenase|nr:2-hydroxyacid dehydrogenase [Clostridiales Family XIII bacterium]
MKVLFIAPETRVRRFHNLDNLPADVTLVFVGSFPTLEEVIRQGADADFLIADAVSTVSKEMIDAMPNLKLIHSEGVGYEGFDVKAATARGIYVCNCAGINASAVAEQAILLMLAVLRHLVEGDDRVRSAQQIETKNQYIMEGIPELGGLKVGLIGFGAIAKETAKKLRAFGSEVFYTGRRPAPKETEAAYGVKYLSLGDLLACCDIVSLHLASNKETFHYIGEAELLKFKPGAILINTARGEIVDQEALVRALKDGRISGAGLDTLYPEPVQADNPLLNLPEALHYKVTFSPHIGGTTQQTFYRAPVMIWENIFACAEGRTPRNIVSK